MKARFGMAMLALLLAVVWFGSRGYAHVTNESSVYEDLEFSEAKEQVLLLSGLNLFPHDKGVQLFRPQEKLTRAELNRWVANFNAHNGGDLEAAKDEEGNATYEDVSRAFFGGRFMPDNRNAELTREEFAAFVGARLHEQVDGRTLFDRAGLTKGPAGAIEDVVAQREGEGAAAYDAYQIAVQGKRYPLHPHPKVLFGSPDAREWEGRTVAESWYREEAGNGDGSGLAIIMLERESGKETEAGSHSASSHQAEDHVHSDEEGKASFPILPIAGAGAVVVLLVWLGVRKRNSGADNKDGM